LDASYCNGSRGFTSTYSNMEHTTVLVTGGTGYIGRRLIPELVTRGHRVRAIVRPGSEAKVPTGAEAAIGDVRSRDSVTPLVTRETVVVHLVGTSRPSPAKAAQFEALDYVAAHECIIAAKSAGARHFVYVSVAQAPVMRAYIGVRTRVESELVESGIAHTLVRPWYVLGPGHRWPYALIPMYWLLGAFPSTRESARRLGLVTIKQMIATLAWSVDTASDESRVLNVPDIRRPR
jgi:uncharacterized protein YbjT (DUF2867 family)